MDKVNIIDEELVTEEERDRYDCYEDRYKKGHKELESEAIKVLKIGMLVSKLIAVLITVFTMLILYINWLLNSLGSPYLILAIIIYLYSMVYAYLKLSKVKATINELTDKKIQ